MSGTRRRKLKKVPVPLLTMLGRRAGIIADDERLVDRIEPLDRTLDFAFFIPGDPVPKKAVFWMQNKWGKKKPVVDRKQAAAEKRAREYILDTLLTEYYESCKYLPLLRGHVSTYGVHLKPPSSDWFRDKPHTDTPDVDNLGKLLKDAPGGRVQGSYPILYGDDCIIDDDWQRKMYWDPECQDPDYPQHPGSLFLVRMSPLPTRPGYHTCEFCGSEYKNFGSYEAHFKTCYVYNAWT